LSIICRICKKKFKKRPSISISYAKNHKIINGIRSSEEILEEIQDSSKLYQVINGEKLSKEIDVITKALINGRGTDERLYNLEMKLKYLNSRLVDLATINFVSPKTEAVKQVNNEQSFNWAELNQLLNK